MNKRIIFLLTIITLFGGVLNAVAQTDTVLGQISSSNFNSFVGGISGDGRLVVFESEGNVATENPSNEDLSREIFLFDYAQRRIYQITDTKSVLVNPNNPVSILNTRVQIGNNRPVISNDGRWISFNSNATTSVAGNPVDGTNPGNFDGNSFTNLVSGASQLDVSTVTGTPTMSNIVQPTAPSVVQIRFTDFNTSITAFSVTVAGTNASNATITETFMFAGGLVQTGTQMFASVTSVTLNSIAGNGTTDTLDFFYGNGNNPLTTDANTEMWLYQVPAVTPVDLSQGDEITPIDLSTGTFTQITNTTASSQPVAGSATQLPRIADDNSNPTISDDGSVVAFVSNRNLVGTGNQAPEDNPEIFTFVRGTATLSQVTQTPRGPVFAPISNQTPTISGNGLRIMFAGNGRNPIVGMTGGNNDDENDEVFFSDLDANGVPTGIKRQVTTTSPKNEGDAVNIINFGRRMSRDGKYIAFDSFADITNEHSGEIQTAFATFLYNTDTDMFRRIGERSDADEGASGGDIDRHPTFTDYVGGEPQTLVLETRMNITAAGTIPTNPEDGLNNIPERPVQIYSYPLNETPANATFTRLSQFPPPLFVLASYQMFPTDTLKRMAVTIPGSEIGTGNSDLSTEAYYLLTPTVRSETGSALSFATGATNIPVTNDPVPTPSPTATPTPSPSPTATPTPQTPPAVQGISRGMLATVNYTSGINQPVIARNAVGSLDRRFQLPMELSGVTMTIGGVTVGLKRVSQRQITFVVPLGLGSSTETPFPVVINNNGIEIKGEIVIVDARPDIFLRSDLPPELNRADILNVTNRVFTREPFTVRTLRFRGGLKVPSVMRLYLTGVHNIQGTSLAINIGGVAIPGTITNAQLVEPGVYYIEFSLPSTLDMAGDVPITVSVLTTNGAFASRLADTAPRVRIL